MATSTTTTLNDIVQATAIIPTMQDYAHDWLVATQHFMYRSLQGQQGNVAQFPRFASNMGTVGDGGTGVDTEFNLTEGTDLSTSTTLSTDSSTVTVSELGLFHLITDNVGEDSIYTGPQFLSMAAQNAARIVQTALEDDACALFASLSNSVGTTTVDITIAQAMAAMDGIRERGYPAPDGVVFVFDDQQWLDVKNLLIATGTSWAVYPAAGDRFLGAAPTPSNGFADGQVGWLFGMPVWSTGLTDTANAGADVVGACFVPSSPANDPVATFGLVDKRPFRAEVQRDATNRGDEIVFTRRVGVGELQDGSGTKIVTDAP